ncbi:unnamed protein product, partial [Ectocarpus fasciculatus]
MTRKGLISAVLSVQYNTRCTTPPKLPCLDAAPNTYCRPRGFGGFSVTPFTPFLFLFILPKAWQHTLHGHQPNSLHLMWHLHSPSTRIRRKLHKDIHQSSLQNFSHGSRILYPSSLLPFFLRATPLSPPPKTDRKTFASIPPPPPPPTSPTGLDCLKRLRM